jgi:phenylacetic acid degradation protein
MTGTPILAPPPQVYSFEGITPVIDPTAYVHPSAVLIGDVIVGPGCFVGACAVMRGDFGRIELRRDANLQDNCVVHSLPDFDCIMDERSHIGHGAIIHGCHIGREVLIGMNAVILDKAVIGDHTIVAAMAFVKVKGVLPPGVLATGVPARVVRELTAQDRAWKRRGTDEYIELAKRCLAGVQQVAPLTALEANRARTQWGPWPERE